MHKRRDGTIDAVLPMLSSEAECCLKQRRGEFRIYRASRESRIIARHDRMNARISTGELGLRLHNLADELEPGRRSCPCQVVRAPELFGGGNPRCYV